MNKKIILILTVFIGGCSTPPENKALKIEKSNYREKSFLTCMTAASKQNNGTHTTMESEVSNTVDSCGSYALSLTNVRF